jgi:hypothetical protein
MSLQTSPPPGKGDPVERLTIEMARRIVADLVERRDRMARKRKQTDEDEIDALVDDLDDEVEDEDEDVEDVEEDEDVEDDEDDEEDEDPDEAPKRARKGRKAKAKKAAPQKTGVGTVEVAEAAGIDSRQLRMYLRSKDIQSGETREGRYHWPSLESKEVKRIIADIRKGAVDRLNKEKIASLKGRKKSTTKKKTTAKKRTKVRSQKK